jgi:Ca2+/Na+ antiporter
MINSLLSQTFCRNLIASLRHKEEDNMGFEVGGIFGLIILVADIWAIVSTFQSQASTGKKVFWIILVLVLPVIGFVVWLLAGPKSDKAS